MDWYKQSWTCVILVNKQFLWKDWLVECVHLFHTRMWAFLNNYIFCQNGILRHVEHHICWYEVQHKLSLYFHINFLWICKDDVDKITNPIATFMPIEYAKLNHEFIHPLYFHQNKIFKFVLRKQLHMCQLKRSYKNSKHCKYGFPYDINLDSPVNRSTNRWEYFRLKHCDWNDVPYHFTLLLILGAHLNIQSNSRNQPKCNKSIYDYVRLVVVCN
jgi:hypothetical protein